MNNNNKVNLTIYFGELRADTSVDEAGNDLHPAVITTKEITTLAGNKKTIVEKVHFPMILVPTGKQVMNINASALYEPAPKSAGIKTSAELIAYNVAAIAQTLGLNMISYSIQ